VEAVTCSAQYGTEDHALWQGEMQSVNAWIGPRRTVMPLHTDPHHSLMCHVYGTVAVMIFPSSESANMQHSGSRYK
jgi:lysine-specific demethylase 8